MKQFNNVCMSCWNEMPYSLLNAWEVTCQATEMVNLWLLAPSPWNNTSIYSINVYGKSILWILAAKLVHTHFPGILQLLDLNWQKIYTCPTTTETIRLVRLIRYVIMTKSDVFHVKGTTSYIIYFRNQGHISSLCRICSEKDPSSCRERDQIFNSAERIWGIENLSFSFACLSRSVSVSFY